MRKALLASATCAFLTASVAAPVAAAEPPSSEPSVTVHHVSPVVQYRLVERQETGGQLDEGTVRVTYTCDPGDLGRDFVFAFVFAGGFMGPTFGEDIPCDDRRHTLELGLSRKTDAPYSPPGRFVDTELFLGFNTGPGGEEVPGGVTEQVRIRFIGF